MIQSAHGAVFCVIEIICHVNVLFVHKVEIHVIFVIQIHLIFYIFILY